jgi:outer membrane protein insertion porin family
VQKIRFIATVIVFSFIALYAQGQLVKIHKINVSGNILADATTIRLNSGLAEGSTAGIEDIQEAVRNLWALKLFSNVQIYLEKQTMDGADLLIKVEEYPRLNRAFISGNDEFDTDEVNDILGFYTGMVVSPSLLFNTRKKLLDKYKEEGFLLAKVNMDTTIVSKNRVDVNIRIYEGLEVQVEKITFHDNHAFDDDDLKDTFEEIKEDAWYRSADFDRKDYEKDLENLVKFYHDNGYRDAEVVRDSVSFSEDGSELFLDIWVYEGNRYYFGDITFKGNEKFSDDYMRMALNIKKGDPYSQTEFEDAFRKNLQNLYYNDGYLFARIIPVEKPVGEDTLNIEFDITEGDVVTIREILISGNDKTEEKVIRREMKLFPGDKFNNALLERSARDIWVLNYFGNVIPDIKLIEGSQKEIDLNVKVEEKSTDTANMSAGYSQRDGLIGSIGLSLNNFSLRHPLSGGGGQRLIFDWQFGSIYRSISLTFVEPWLFDRPTKAGFSIYNTYSGNLRFYGYEQRRQGFSLFLGRRFKWPDNFMRGDWSFLYSNIDLKYNTDIYQDNSYSRYYVGAESDPTSFESIGIRQILSRDTRNRPEFPTNGSVVSLNTELRWGPNEDVIRYEKFLKNEFTIEWFTPMFLNTVFYTRSKLGLINEIGKNSFISQPAHFYLGGNGMGIAEALRGYDDGQVGPKTTSGTPIGGNSLFSITFEWRFQIAPSPTIYGLLFAEAGNVWRSADQFVPGSLARSAGVGVRLFMPMVGIIGVDFGYGFDNVNYLGEKEGQWKIHFQFGRF